MARLVAFFLDRPLVVKLVIFAVAILGIIAIAQIQKEGFPNITIKNVIVTTIYPGASARDVEMNVTVPIEEKLNEVTGIQKMTSTSQDGISTVVAEVDENATKGELKKVYDDIDSAIGQIDDLPADLDGRPTLKLITSADLPVIEVALAGQGDELKKFARLLETKIKTISAVTQVELIGLPDDEVHILVDAQKARRMQIGLRSIANAIRARNMEGSGGTLESFLTEKKVVSVNKFADYEDVLNTYLRVSDLGYAVQLKRLAEIKVVPKEMNLRVRNNGKPGVSLMVLKNGKADIIETIDEIKAVVDGVKRPEGVGLTYLNDQSKVTRDRLKLVSSNAIVGAILVMGVLLIVFNWRVALWTAFGIPFSFLGAFILLQGTDETLNMLTLGGFIIVLGMLVDDAIVVAENIQSYREKGMKAYDACVQAVKDIWLPVLAASLTTMMAFTPVLSFGGLPGQFIYIIPLIVILALTVSLFDAYFILPAHLMHAKDSANKAAKKSFVLKLEKFYEKWLTTAIKYKYICISIFFLLFILTLISARFFVKSEAFPQEAAEAFSIQYRLERGASFDKTLEVVKVIEGYLNKLPEEELVGFSTRMGTQSTDKNAERGSQHNLGITFVYLHPYSNRSRTAEEIMQVLRGQFKQDELLQKDVKQTTVELTAVGPPMGKAFEIQVSSNNDAVRDAKAKEVKEFLATLDGVFEVDDDDIQGKDELNVQINHRTLNRAGLTIENVLQTLRIAFDGQVVTNMVTLDQTVDFRLRLNEEGRADINFIKSLPIQNSAGFLINLGQFVSADTRPAKSDIKHVNGKRTTTIFGNLDKEKIAGSEIVAAVKEKFKNGNDYQINFAGQPVESAKIFGNIGIAGLIAILGVYVIISLIFNSLTQPLIIILAIPLGLIGIILAAITHGAPMSMFAGIALIGLTGVIVNDAIVMVHTIKEKAKEKLNDLTLVEGAVGRLRPILLTTATTVLGVMPTAYGIGGMDPFISQMCLFLGYGLIFGTLVILFFIPTAFSVTLKFNKN